MNILLVSATQAEIKPYCDLTGLTEENSVSFNNHKINLLISGVGICASAFAMGRNLALNKYDLIIQAGIAGAIDQSLHIGQTVNVKSDLFYKFGSDDGENFISVFDLGFFNRNEYPFGDGKLMADDVAFANSAISDLTSVEGITVQTVHGNRSGIDTLKKLYPHAQVESQEGASVLYAARMMHTPCIQLRAISNYVEVRNRENWNIPEAIKSLNETLLKFLKQS